ncbi:DNA (cytosine-5-)-methyltransferase [Candidatus Uhrbacteria bacterium CG_4_9_14_3_um_filter_36_7]|uniref:Cytosine-specific methyltransferase n=1 Tax=Candidatus Uhrbacteria bacterium CG_4_9_14_3_um_filter_36_7 TaxID=1975033 RepID=A0A2M7XGJ6_9BACT|nr:MAG: DNA (cytosine-5-)-methyltransferase [Candidatus Uhrbacteria bacterium CG_4_9_14_3_um_filter_36_7]
MSTISQYFTAGEAATKIGISIDTIRRWDKKGLIMAKRDTRNARIFSIDELNRIQSRLGNNNSENRYKILKNKNKSKYSVIELFAGAGGTALGMENAGIKHVLLNEWDKHACSTLRTNRPDWNVIECDVRELKFFAGQADIVQGGFPCQAFSSAGNKMGFEDIRGTMFFEFARCVKEVRPKIAIGENVRGLLTHDNGRTLKTMVLVLEDLGYKVKYKVLKSHYFDVPQKRERLIIIGVRNDLKIPIVFPKERDYVLSLKEALYNCPKSEGQEYPKNKKKIMELIPAGGYWRDLPEKLQKEYMGASFYMGGGKTGMARRLSWDEPSLTLTCSPAQKQTERCHPVETRPLSVREYARIQTFPDNWKFSGSVAQQYKQIGNAVPVNLSYHIGNLLIKMLSGEIKEVEEEETIQPALFALAN